MLAYLQYYQSTLASGDARTFYPALAINAILSEYDLQISDGTRAGLALPEEKRIELTTQEGTLPSLLGIQYTSLIVSG